jgi:membrane protein implicated in regulation of membrane protease activity
MILFFLIAVAGLMMLALSVIVGELFEFLDFDFGDVDVGGDGGGPITTPAISLGLTAFGATGMITQWAGWGVVPSVITSFASAIAFAALGAWLAIMFYRQTSGTDDAFASVVGSLGEVVTSITSTPGEVQISSYGSTHTRLARSASGDRIPTGTVVRIVDVMGNTLVVERASYAAVETEKTEEARA